MFGNDWIQLKHEQARSIIRADEVAQNSVTTLSGFLEHVCRRHIPAWRVLLPAKGIQPKNMQNPPEENSFSDTEFWNYIRLIACTEVGEEQGFACLHLHMLVRVSRKRGAFKCHLVWPSLRRRRICSRICISIERFINHSAWRLVWLSICKYLWWMKEWTERIAFWRKEFCEQQLDTSDRKNMIISLLTETANGSIWGQVMKKLFESKKRISLQTYMLMTWDHLCL